MPWADAVAAVTRTKNPTIRNLRICLRVISAEKQSRRIIEAPQRKNLRFRACHVAVKGVLNVRAGRGPQSPDCGLRTATRGRRAGVARTGTESTAASVAPFRDRQCD